MTSWTDDEGLMEELARAARQEEEVCREEQDQEREAGRSLRGHSIGWSFNASFKLPRR